MKQPYYISATIPYVNAAPHIGHALEYVQADAAARYHRLLGNDVFFLGGTDENSLKNVQAADKAGRPVDVFVTEHAEYFRTLASSLEISFDDFIRTTQERHKKGAQALWSRFKAEDIYKKTYKGLYCVGCELFYREDELFDGNCPEHRSRPELVEEENYFFKLSNYQEKLYRLISSDKLKIIPEIRKNEMLAFIERGLEDFSISRSHERAHGWGVPVPNDASQIMYVWVDALSNYINALDYEHEAEPYRRFWIQEDRRHVVHVLGKGVARFHAIYWPAMLLSAGVPLPTEEFVHGYITVEGEKMSKSLGNVLHPNEVVADYGTDAVRFFFLGALSPYQDSDFSRARFEEFYTAHLVNGVGNLTARVLSMLEKYAGGTIPAPSADTGSNTEIWGEFWHTYRRAFAEYRFDEAVAAIIRAVGNTDRFITEHKPWERAKQGEDVSGALYDAAESVRHIALALLPIIPTAAADILSRLSVSESEQCMNNNSCAWGGLSAHAPVSKGTILFPRIS